MRLYSFIHVYIPYTNFQVAYVTHVTYSYKFGIRASCVVLRTLKRRAILRRNTVF